MRVENRFKMNEFELAHGYELGGERTLQLGEDGGFLLVGQVELAGAESMDTGILRGVGFALFGDGPGGTAGVDAVGFDFFGGN